MTDWLEPRPAGAPVGIVCGTMNFGKRTPEEEAHRIVARSLERGVTLFDTANAYGDSELVLGRALRGRRSARIAGQVASRTAAGGRAGLEAEAGRALRVEPPKGSRFDGNKMYQRRYLSDRFFDLVVSYSELAREAGLTPVQLAYGWLGTRSGVDSVLLGPADVAQLDAGIDACAKPLGADLCERIDEIHRAYTGTDATYARLD